ncbi:MAG: threonylcarbamoyl-AMP synthase [Prolixibacteraceae bacterium]|jgi:L-threonylcarbamoyladenylate synthase|nr:threonylcarbamoyl-AMP synthase [Prolixibacteraceae bacterium]NLX29947.1 threonylcarbamoyl-AMP synthase [Bacteroidales bacterium]
MNERDLAAALETLRRGGVILYPTDTVWGLGCDATNEKAVERIFTIKKRPDHKSMLVLMENPALLDRYVEEVPEVAWDLIEITTTPLTIIYDRARNLAPNLVGEDGSIGIRFTREAFSAELIRRFRKPLVSTSANLSGEKTPAIFSEIADTIKQAVDYVVEFRRDDPTIAKPSSILKLGRDGRLDIIRP